ncbi:DUF4442 domain-containing protein [Lolliginicoccus suaedae]|uniref:DUF4442 domain-containing protein n=1 Tax=Lolliginicoccus suaedae TaxID=2605429 RepID=UPI0011ECA116|nr:DUF4442 domain-containing protein [Lolliginicoccus suaedae]
MQITPRTLKWGMRAWPPFLGAGIKVESIAEDWSRAVVSMKVTPLTRNAVGTAFGGSLSSMTDPFFMLLLLPQLGDDHYVWDTRGEIEYRKPGTGRLTATMDMPPEVVAAIRERAAGGERVLTWFSCDIRDESGDVVATVRREVYTRLKARRSIAAAA